MDLFELLFIFLFVLIPIMEQVLKRRRQGPGVPGSQDDEDASDSEAADGRLEGGPGSPDAGRGPEGEPVRAEDMVPDDLWAILTGERRSTGASSRRPGTPAEARNDAPAEAGPPWSTDAGDAGTEGAGPWDAPTPAWEVDDEAEVREPVSAEYRGPEAYSLESLDYDAVSLEVPAPAPMERVVPSAAARHARFHELIDRPKRRPRSARSAIGRTLTDPDSLRQAFVLAEILGPPKGLG